MIGANDHQLVAAIQDGENSSLEDLYHDMKPKILHYVTTNRGSIADAKDVLQDSMIVLHRNVRSGKFRGDSSLGTYLYSICKWRWLGELRKRGKETELNEEIATELVESSELPGAETYRTIENLFRQIDEGCRRVLTASFYDNKQMTEIAAEQGWKNEQIARNKKFRCLKKLKELIEVTPVLKAQLMDIWQNMS